jgi:hypothetical protein
MWENISGITIVLAIVGFLSYNSYLDNELIIVLAIVGFLSYNSYLDNELIIRKIECSVK